jgi:hypothetical protein
MSIQVCNGDDSLRLFIRPLVLIARYVDAVGIFELCASLRANGID